MAAPIAPKLLALFQKEGVVDTFLAWLGIPEAGITTVHAFAASASIEERVNSDLADVCGIVLTVGQKANSDWPGGPPVRHSILVQLRRRRQELAVRPAARCLRVRQSFSGSDGRTSIDSI